MVTSMSSMVYLSIEQLIIHNFIRLVSFICPWMLIAWIDLFVIIGQLFVLDFRIIFELIKFTLEVIWSPEFTIEFRCIVVLRWWVMRISHFRWIQGVKSTYSIDCYHLGEKGRKKRKIEICVFYSEKYPQFRLLSSRETKRFVCFYQTVILTFDVSAFTKDFLYIL